MADIAGDLLPCVLCPPWYFPKSFDSYGGRFEVTSDFISRVERSGDPNQRYRYYHIVNEVGDIHKFDQVVFSIRRVTYPLDMVYCDTSKSYREMLSSNRLLQPHPKFSFDRSGWKRGEEERMRILKWQNFSFFEDDAIDVGQIQKGLSSINSPISMNLNKTEERSQALNWFMQHAKFSKKDRVALLEAIGAKS
ncbi:hypothetical protein [Roseobacter sp.]|uniref:hypothetical protein n=1 Tax=Roseobacter sp. TaxID=1907202 RepID=UPI0029664189|nr:hypothetical protein [Roseobacter sp.]